MMLLRIKEKLDYLSGYNNNSKSYYAKYLSIDLLKKLQWMGYKCVFMDIKRK